MKKLLSLSVLVWLFLGASPASADTWESFTIKLSGTSVDVYEYGAPSVNKAVLLPGGNGIIKNFNKSDRARNALGAAYERENIQLVVVSIPYFKGRRHTVRAASQEVLNILNVALRSGYLRRGYTLLGGSAGTLMISSMLDFNQRGENRGPRLIDNVGRVVLLAGPHHNAKITSSFILKLIKDNKVVKPLATLNTRLTVEARWGMYLNKLINGAGLKIVIGDRDYVLCRDNRRCNSRMDVVTNNWVKTVSGGMSIRELPEIVKVIRGAGHTLPTEQFIDFIIDRKTSRNRRSRRSQRDRRDRR